MGIDRRRFLQSGAIVTVFASCKPSELPDITTAPVVLPPDEPGVIRLASVKTAVEGKLIPELIARFEAAQPLYKVRLQTGVKVYDSARRGEVDLVISHYGHKDAEQFVLDGAGEFPRTIFSNQMALVGPPSDPAGVRGTTDLVEAFRKIAATKTPFVVNDLDGVRYLTEILWHAIGKPARDGWMIDHGDQRIDAIVEAAKQSGYTLWGLTPFQRTDKAESTKLVPLFLDDPLLHRLMVSVVVKPAGSRKANHAGATALQSYLLDPATQAAIRSTHYADDVASWTPAGRHNRTAILPKRT